MATIDQLMDAHVGRGESLESGVSTIKELFNAIHTDLTAIRTAFVTLTAKIDADSTDTGGDSDYASTCDPAALTLIKGT